MDIILIIIWIIALFAGIIGDFLPILPGPILSYLAILVLQIADKPFSTEFMIILAIICILITTVDYIIPILGTKKMWWTKRGTKWSTIWLIVWIIILPILWITLWPFGLIWLFWWPFLGAYIWEKLYQSHHKQKTNNRQALKAAFGSLLWFASGILLKLIYTIVIAIYFFPKAFVIIKNFF
jgi:uncharacterized protein YqgC (DUF456 family)